jgi:hypothetical protein
MLSIKDGELDTKLIFLIVILLKEKAWILLDEFLVFLWKMILDKNDNCTYVNMINIPEWWC